jgi:adenine-specific DNA-methyltransferase
LRWFSQDVLKIPIAPFYEKRNQIVALVEKILAVKQDNPMADVSELQGYIDEIVWGLYGLGEEDRKLIIKV